MNQIRFKRLEWTVHLIRIDEKGSARKVVSECQVYGASNEWGIELFNWIISKPVADCHASDYDYNKMQSIGSLNKWKDGLVYVPAKLMQQSVTGHSRRNCLCVLATCKQGWADFHFI